MIRDATEYYALTQSMNPKKHGKRYGGELEETDELKAECYIGFLKLLNDELKAFDSKDSYIHDMKLNQGRSTLTNALSVKLVRELSEKLPSMGNLNATDPNTPTITLSSKKPFSERLWFCGQPVGYISGFLTFYNLPILYQMKVGVLTRNGIYFSSRPFVSES